MKKLLLTCLISAMYLSHTYAQTELKSYLCFTPQIETRAESAFSGGSGTAEDPYLISTAEDLSQLSDDVQNFIMYENKYFKMTNDIDMSETGNFLPIGNNIESSDVKAFCGIFDGNNCTVKGIKAEYKGVNSIGVAMFGVTMMATIQNLYMEDCKFSADALVAPIVAVAMGTTVKNCHVGKNVVADAYKMFNSGGVVCGAMGMPCVIEDCSSEALVHSGSYTAGGILSAISEGAAGTIVKRCIFSGKSSAFDTVAGIVALFEYPGVIEDCANLGEIVSGAGAAGIEFIYNGQDKDFLKISNCYNVGRVEGVDESHEDAVSFGNVFTGGGEGSCTVENCYYADDLSEATSVTATAMTSSDMKTADFVDKLNNGREDGPWRIVEGVANGFPVPFEFVETSINDVQNVKTKIYYASGYVTVSGVKTGENFAIVDMSGCTVKNVVAQTNGVLTIDLTSLPAGVYVVSNGNVSKKIVK